MTRTAHGLPARYTVERELGRGGMGVVYQAADSMLGIRVAIKVMNPTQLEAPSAVSRFMQEGRLCARLRSEHCVKIFDLGLAAGGEPYLVMEYLEGTDLAAYLRDRKRLPFAEAALYAMQACKALVEVHALGIVHRDLKPHNLFLAPAADGTRIVKVLDFGLAKVPYQTALTATGAMLGTPSYMAPEQIHGRTRPDARTDIWALGVVLYELCAGERPFVDTTLGRTARRIVEVEPKPLASLVPDLPVEFADLVQRCLRKEPDPRFRGADELAKALAPFVSSESRPRVVVLGSSSEVPKEGFSSANTSLAPPLTMPKEEARSKPSTSRRNIFLQGALLGLGLISVSAVALFALSRKASSQPVRPVESAQVTAPPPSDPSVGAATPLMPLTEASQKPAAAHGAPDRPPTPAAPRPTGSSKPPWYKQKLD